VIVVGPVVVDDEETVDEEVDDDEKVDEDVDDVGSEDVDDVGSEDGLLEDVEVGVDEDEAMDVLEVEDEGITDVDEDVELLEDDTSVDEEGLVAVDVVVVIKSLKSMTTIDLLFFEASICSETLIKKVNWVASVGKLLKSKSSLREILVLVGVSAARIIKPGLSMSSKLHIFSISLSSSVAVTSIEGDNVHPFPFSIIFVSYLSLSS